MHVGMTGRQSLNQMLVAIRPWRSRLPSPSSGRQQRRRLADLAELTGKSFHAGH